MLTVHCSEAGSQAAEARCSVLESPLSERYGLAVTAFAARRVHVFHRLGCRIEFLMAAIIFIFDPISEQKCSSANRDYFVYIVLQLQADRACCNGWAARHKFRCENEIRRKNSASAVTMGCPRLQRRHSYAISIGYNTVWSASVYEQTHSRQCCNLLIAWLWTPPVIVLPRVARACDDQSTVHLDWQLGGCQFCAYAQCLRN